MASDFHHQKSPPNRPAQDMKNPRNPLKTKGLGDFPCGTPEGTRTPNIQNRNLTLYPLNYGRISRRLCKYSRNFPLCKVVSAVLARKIFIFPFHKGSPPAGEADML